MLKFGEIGVYLGLDIRDNKKHRPALLFAKNLVEANTITSYRDSDNNEYVRLRDLLKYRGYRLPYSAYNQFTDLSYDECPYYIPFTLHYIPCLSIRDTVTGKCVYDMIASYLGEICMSAWTLNEYIDNHGDDDPLIEILKPTGLLDWHGPETATQVWPAIGSEDWDYFAVANETNLLILTNGHMKVYGVYSKKKGIDKLMWFNLITIFKELGINYKQFGAYDILSVDESMFRRFVTGGHPKDKNNKDTYPENSFYFYYEYIDPDKNHLI